MRMSTPAVLAIAAINLLALPAAAQSLPSVPFVAVDVPVPTVDAGVPADDAVTRDATLGTAVPGDALDDMRGGTETKTTITNVSDVNGNVDGNAAINTISGGNLMDGGAFGNAAGLSTVIQNSGNNVLIQNSTVVSVLFSPTP
ncbi:hypothetical protein [Cognatilysobacter segetis]|uniref:hypothetical protein n=1 Tax=Cognatilysobacter segetis TaxID=2492394 RepID=UPI001060C1D5|nr:hypothetical protein [Lysobacter segetis]